MAKPMVSKGKALQCLDIMPQWRAYTGQAVDLTLAALWSGKETFATPPTIGDRCFVSGGFGSATVTGYFVEHGFLGVVVQPDTLPEWFQKQAPGRKVVSMFGIDLSPVA
jgi:hypothetical protein